jgi:hypothetical protein
VCPRYRSSAAARAGESDPPSSTRDFSRDRSSSRSSGSRPAISWNQVVPVQRSVLQKLDDVALASLHGVEYRLAQEFAESQRRLASIHDAERWVDIEAKRVLPEDLAAESVNRADEGAIELSRADPGRRERFAQLASKILRGFLGEGDRSDASQIARSLAWRHGAVPRLAHREPQPPKDLAHDGRRLAGSRVRGQQQVSGLGDCGVLLGRPALSHRPRLLRRPRTDDRRATWRPSS